MKKEILAGAILLPFTLAFSQPKASIESDSIKFGDVYAGEVRTARIRVSNIGNKPLEIVQVQTSCGCTTTKQPSGAIAPGNSDDIEVTYNSTGFRGEIHKQVYVTTNDPSGQSFVVTMVGTIKEELEPVGISGLLWLSTVQLGKSVEQAVSWKNVSGKPITVRKVSSDADQFKIKWERKTIPPNETFGVQVLLTATKENYQAGTITLETDSPRQKFVTMKVSFIGQKEVKP